MKLISKTKPSGPEVDANPRARSAVLRVAERLGTIAEGSRA
jgi:16S rRNA (cytosine1402-N4)-methyltransferase